MGDFSNLCKIMTFFFSKTMILLLESKYAKFERNIRKTNKIILFSFKRAQRFIFVAIFGNAYIYVHINI